MLRFKPFRHAGARFLISPQHISQNLFSDSCKKNAEKSLLFTFDQRFVLDEDHNQVYVWWILQLGCFFLQGNVSRIWRISDIKQTPRRRKKTSHDVFSFSTAILPIRAGSFCNRKTSRSICAVDLLRFITRTLCFTSLHLNATQKGLHSRSISDMCVMMRQTFRWILISSVAERWREAGLPASAETRNRLLTAEKSSTDWTDWRSFLILLRFAATRATYWGFDVQHTHMHRGRSATGFVLNSARSRKHERVNTNRDSCQEPTMIHIFIFYAIFQFSGVIRLK